MKQSVDQILRAAHNMEKVAEEFYRAAADKFEGTEMQMILLQLAEEEAQHQTDIEKMSETVRNAIGAETVLEIERVMPDLSRFESVAAEGDMESVARFALGMEQAAVGNYAALADKANGEAREMLVELRDFEQKHVEMIERMLKDLRIDPKSDDSELHSH